jgi:hypothetical protein
MPRALFYIMTSFPAFIKVGKTPATQNLALEQYAVKIGKSTHKNNKWGKKLTLL